MLRPVWNRNFQPVHNVEVKKHTSWQRNSHEELKKIESNCGKSMKEYLENSSLHGLKYIGQTEITIYERVFYGISFALVFFLSAYFISNIYAKWSATPVIVTLGATSTSIIDLPFPAVTICNMNKARNSIVTTFAKDSFQSRMLQNWCYDQYDNLTIDSSTIPKESGDWNVIRQHLLNISQPCNEMLVKCRYALETYDCMDLFDTVLSDEGLCCIYNAVAPSFLYVNPLNASNNFDDDYDYRVIPIDWTPEKGYANVSIKKHSTPRPAAGSGSHLGLYFVLNAETEDYYCSSTDSAGFKVLLHNPTETPRITDFGMLVSPGKESRIIITPKILTASRQIRDVDHKKRQCIFPNEAKLKYYRTYSRRNCEMECFSEAIETECDCSIYYMPRLSSSARVCSRADSVCYNTVRLSIERGESTKYNCECDPGCDELSFTGTITFAELMTPHMPVQSALVNFSAAEIERDIAVVKIYYEENYFRSTVQNEFIGFTEFLSNTGGLLGLFMGFSVVSLIEIFYFIALRPYFRKFYHGKPSKNSKSTGTRSKKKLNTISNMISQYQSRDWSDAWFYEKNHQKNAINSNFSSYNTNYQNIQAAKRWKPTTFTH